MQKLETAFVRLNKAVLMALLSAMALIIFANVVLRYTTSESIEWAEEVARYLMVWLTFLGAGLVLRYGGHIAIDNLQDSVPRKAAMAIRCLISTILFAFFIYMAWVGMMYVERSQFQMTPTTQVSMAWVYSAMPIGGLLLVIHFALVVKSYIIDRSFAADEHFDANASASL